MKARSTITLLLALATGLAAACGSDEEKGSPIPQQAVVDLDSRLGEVERRMEAGGGACGDITNDSAPAVSQIIESLPDDVDPDVRQALQDGFDRLFTLTGEQCDEAAGQETEPEPEPEPTETEELPTETEELPTETEPLPTETTEEPPIDPVEPDGDSSGDDGSGGTATPEDEG